MLVLNIQDSEDRIFCNETSRCVFFCCRITFIWQSQFRHLETCSSGIKIGTNHLRIIQNGCRVILGLKQPASHHLLLAQSLHRTTTVTAALGTPLRCPASFVVQRGET